MSVGTPGRTVQQVVLNHYKRQTNRQKEMKESENWLMQHRMAKQREVHHAEGHHPGRCFCFWNALTL